MEVNEAMVKLGFMKKWQMLCFFMILFMMQPISVLNINSILFFAYIPKHHCQFPNHSSIQQWIPKDENGKFESCSMFVNSSVSNETVYCPDGWQYEDQDWGRSIINEWDLVCEKALYSGCSHMVFVLGLFFSSFLGGLSDIFGRKPISIIFLILISLNGIAVSFSRNFTDFVIGKFFLGVLEVNSINFSVYLTELTSNLNRDLVVSVGCLHWGVILSILILLAYLIQNWRYLKLTICLYSLSVLPIIILFLPETVYWLHANNRIKEAEDVLISAGKLNNVQFTRPILIQKENQDNSKDIKYFEEKTFSKKVKNFLTKLLARTFGSDRSSKTQYKIKELFRNPYLLRHMAFGIVILIDFFLIMSLSFISTSISTYRFFSAFLNVSIQIPAGFVCFFLIKKNSMRNSMILFMLLTAASIFICYLFLLLTSEQVTNYTTVFFIVAAKFFSSIVTALLYTYLSTLFPTNLRNRAYSICLLVGRVGSLLSSFSTYLLMVLPIGSYVIFASSALICALLLFIFPDTSGLSLPETIEDIENIYKKNKNGNTKLLEKKEFLADEQDVDE